MVTHIPLDPDSDTLRFHVPIAPVSLQASAAKKATIAKAIRDVVAPMPYIFTDDVRLSIDWLINPHERYETDSAADIDNIVKPIIDSLCGPAGILINDCQLQRCDVLWRDRYESDQSIELELRYERDAWWLKKDLVFLLLGRGLAFPLDTDPPALVVPTAERVLEMFARRDEINSMIGNRLGDAVQPIQRVYHVSRVQEFQRFTIDELRKRYPPE